MTNQQEQRAPGFNCPVCDFFIETSIQHLLFGKQHVCAQCQTTFDMQRQESKEALIALQKLHTAMENMEAVKKVDR